MFLKFIIVFLVSMVPLIELRGAVPIGVGFGLPEWAVSIVAMFGNFIPVPLIFIYARRFLEWGEKVKWKKFAKFCKWCLKKGEKGGKKLQKKAGDSIYVALALFVGVPFPGTGAWTGTLAASMLNLDKKKTYISVACGLIMACSIMLLVSFGLFKVIA
ncbi:small multi-drug export protein [Candidatus Saccharibacteria bacterium]|nr:small multi-drug export protein [Candidatus Saccharibacteria bacterium]